MGLSILLVTIRDYLRLAFADPKTPTLHEDSIDVMPGPNAPAFAGQYFLAVHGLNWSPGPTPDMNIGLDESFGVQVTLTARSRAVPYDRAGRELYIKTAEGMEAIIRKVNAAVLGSMYTSPLADQGILQTINTDDNDTPIVEPLRFLGSDPFPRPVPSTWFDPFGTQSPRYEAVAAYVMSTRFGGARRMSPYDLME